MKNVTLGLAAVLGLSLGFSRAAQGAVIVTEGLATTAWPDTGPSTVTTMTTPVATSAAGGTAGVKIVSQTFTSPISGYLDIVDFTYTSTAGTYNLALYEVISANTPDNATVYTLTSSNQFSSGLVFTVATSTGTASAGQKVVKLDFTGMDQVALASGHFYAFELTKASGGDISMWRRGSSTYSGGDGFVDRKWVNSTGSRDFAFNAIITVPEPATLGMLGLGLAGLVSLRRRQI